MSEYPRVLPVGETAFTVEFGDAVDVALNRQVHALDAALRAQPVPGIVETAPTYRSLLVMYDPRVSSADAMRAVLLNALGTLTTSVLPEGRLVDISVHYGGAWGPDLADVAAHCGISAGAVIELHAQPIYTVAMLGFAPGFAYLLGLPEALATPRLATPRVRVPPGSVGIAGAQTGVYALETPGGWRIIGRTDLALFDPAREAPFALQAGDRVRFVPL
ncbi:MAG TPA: 5-oxoprolinase subunit PxpB [Anaerolineae bacterium]|nr:5-oxoprolinase subunit PxpB [Anaerolineae bacterium]HQI87296.1 5-oxoprolinase subunit PxpB [Anaerolineae bacterium]